MLRTDTDVLLPIYDMKEADVLLSHPLHHHIGRLGKHNGQLMLDKKLWWCKKTA